MYDLNNYSSDKIRRERSFMNHKNGDSPADNRHNFG